MCIKISTFLTNSHDIRNIVQVPIDEILEDAQHTMDIMRGKRRRPEDPLPYTVEAERDECLAEYESDESHISQIRRQGHLFTTSVSHDVIQYGLRSPSPVNSEVGKELEFARLENIKSITEKLRAARQVEEESSGEGDEEEEDEATVEDSYTREVIDVLGENRQSLKFKKGKEKKESLRNRDRDEKFDPATLNLLDFIDEFIDDDEEGGDEGDLDNEKGEEIKGTENMNEGDLQVLAEPKELAGSDESGGESASP